MPIYLKLSLTGALSQRTIKITVSMHPGSHCVSDIKKTAALSVVMLRKLSVGQKQNYKLNARIS